MANYAIGDTFTSSSPEWAEIYAAWQAAGAPKRFRWDRVPVTLATVVFLTRDHGIQFQVIDDEFNSDDYGAERSFAR